MRHRELLLTALLFVVTIFVITKMVTAHAEDSSDESSAYPTPTDITDFIETPYPTMTEMAYDEGDPSSEPTQTDVPQDAEPTTVAEATMTPTPSLENPADLVTTTPQFEALPALPLAAEPPREENQEIVTTQSIDTSTVPEHARLCSAGTVELISGTTHPSTMLEVRFDQRVIGGGMSDTRGRYTIPLHMGIEARGRHPVTVVKRYSGRLIQQVFCDIP